jgi:hypothetical protein
MVSPSMTEATPMMGSRATPLDTIERASTRPMANRGNVKVIRRAIDGDNVDDRERALQYQQAHFTLSQPITLKATMRSEIIRTCR